MKPPFPLPQVATVSVVYGGGLSIEFLSDADQFFTWKGAVHSSTPQWIRDELVGWIAIQRERKRLKLPYLTFSEPIREPR